MDGLADTALKKRHAWLAALLSLLLPGLGQLYNRHARLALILIIIALLVAIPGRWLIAAVPSAAVVTVTAIAVTAAITNALFAAVQAAIGARRAGGIAPAWFHRWYVYLGLIALATACQEAAKLLPIPNIKSYSMPSASNVPTLLVGDKLVARTRAFSDGPPSRGDLAVFLVPGTPGDVFLKRVIGLPGDTVQMVDGILNINGSPVQRSRIEDYVDPNEPSAAPVPQYVETLPGGSAHRIIEVEGDVGEFDNTEAYVVPDGAVFVLGDNRDRSNDSRAKIGFIPTAAVLDKPLFLFWSGDLSRIGKVVE